jgi:deoxyribonuclease V
VEVDRTGTTVMVAVMVLDSRTLEPLEGATHIARNTFPVLPGYRSFREVPALVAALKKLARAPHVILVNRPGVAHPKKLGTAAHLGLWVQVPTVGVASDVQVAVPPPLADTSGTTAPVLAAEDGLVVALAVRTRASQPPLFVSVGHKVTLVEGANLTLQCCKNRRVPEPLRLAQEQVLLLRKNVTHLDAEMAALVTRART